ncbi:MAG: dihydroorotase [Solobacterium sp.]|jgi:dihydroorotase|nr:dihydroorotase [Solobacterium sp.]MCH4221896.1 dihydroorotase [Solobacterium sp.]MCH4265488.1 dihydroorotase [Solobacterium sp.]
MSIFLRNGLVYTGGEFQKKNLLVKDRETIIQTDQCPDDAEVIDCTGFHILPGLIDPHVHLREPGHSEKETILSGSKAAAHGGFTSIFAMPNLNPVPDSVEHLNVEQNIIDRDAVIGVLPVASITQNQQGEAISDIAALSMHTILFSDDGVGVQSEAIMEQAMKEVARCHGVILAHCEDNRQVARGWRINAGHKAEELGLIGVNNESEASEVRRNIELVRKTGCQLHICHISAKESIEAVRRARKEGLPVTAEATPHHLLLCEDDITENHGRFRMNPPLRSREDQLALVEAIQDGTVTMIATDHAPHTREQKDTDLEHALNGIVGLETSFPLIYTYLVKTGKITMERCMELMSINAHQTFHMKEHGLELADLSIWNLEEAYQINPDEFLSMGKSTPFAGQTVYGRCELTISKGTIAYRRN